MSSGWTSALTSPKRQQVVARLEPENREHRVRPEDAAAREIPVPQAAAAAVERGVDARCAPSRRSVGLARPRRLPVKGEAEDQHHEAGRGGERDGESGVGAPSCSASARGWTTASWPIGERAHGGERQAAVGERDFQDAGARRRTWSAAASGRARRSAGVRPLPPRAARSRRMCRQDC